MRAGTKKIHIGLKWKAVIYLSLVLMILNGGFFFFNYFSIGKQSELQRESNRIQYRKELSRLLDLTSDRLQRLAEILPSLSGIHASLANSDSRALIASFEPHWQSLNLDMDIHVVGFFDSHANALGQWHAAPLAPQIMSDIQDQVKEVLNQEAPLSRTYCGSGCIQFSAIPVLSNEGASIGSVVLGRSIAYLLLELHDLSGVDIGLLSPVDDMSGTSLGEWNLQLRAMTNRNAIEPMLQTLASKHPLPVNGSGSWVFEAAEQHLEVTLFPLFEDTTNGPLTILVSDISQAMMQAQQAIHTNALIAVIGLVVSEVLLLILLWRPTSRIRETVRLLPLLAEHDFEQFRLRVKKQSTHLFEDETDVLCNTADTLAVQLETLQAEVDTRTRELRLNRDHLQERVDEQTADLKAAKETAVTANRAKSEFLANMSHELRTPMHAILSFAAMGIDKIDSAPKEKLLRYFSRIHDSGNRLLNLLNDLLDLSKLEAGRMLIERGEHDLRSLVELSRAELGELLRNKSLDLEIAPYNLNTHAQFDHDKILQVVRNLLSNAIKFTPTGKKIRILFSETTLPNMQQQSSQRPVPALSLTVSDEGIGIPDEELETVFDKFVQSSKTRSGAGGTGLGLAICKEIIKGHGGHIWAEHNSQGGADFSFAIPQPPTGSLRPVEHAKRDSA